MAFNVRFEFDRHYSGGPNGDSGVAGGSYRLIPLSIVQVKGAVAAFVEITGLAEANIVRWSLEELYDGQGNLIEEH